MTIAADMASEIRSHRLLMGLIVNMRFEVYYIPLKRDIIGIITARGKTNWAVVGNELTRTKADRLWEP